MSQTVKNVWLYCEVQTSMDAATGVAVEVTKRHDAMLTLVGVIEESYDPLLQTPLGRDLVRLVREDQRQRMGKLVELARHQLLQSRLASIFLEDVEGGIPWHTLTSHAVKHQPDLVVVPADGGASAGPFGTFSQHLFRKCPAPVWSVQAGTSPTPKRALVEVDSGTEGSDARLLSQEILRVAIGLATSTEMELHVCKAWNLAEENLIASRFGAKGTQPYMDIQSQYARDFTDQLLKQTGYEGNIAAVHYPKGEPGIAIPPAGKRPWRRRRHPRQRRTSRHRRLSDRQRGGNDLESFAMHGVGREAPRLRFSCPGAITMPAQSCSNRARNVEATVF